MSITKQSTRFGVNLKSARRIAAVSGGALALIGMTAAPAAADMYGNMHGGATYAMNMPVAATVTAPVNVQVKRPQVLRLSRPATSVIVGDPTIADVAVHSTDTLLILGRSYGTTNVIALDGAGRVIIDSDINVSEYHAGQGLRVYAGANKRSSYRCAPDCLPAPSLGDTPEFISTYRQGAPSINNNVATGPTGQPPMSSPSFEPSQSFPSPGSFPPGGDLPPGFETGPGQGFLESGTDS